MTITNENARVRHAGNGSSTVFTYNFRILDDDDIKVVLQSSAGVDTVQTKTTHYSVSGVGDAGGGTVTMVTAPASGETLSLIINSPATQETDYATADGFSTQETENALDNVVNSVKRAIDQVGRALRLQDGDADGSGAFDANSNKLANLADGTATTDAATLANVNALIASASIAPLTNVISALGGGYTIDLYRYQTDDTGSTPVDLNTRMGETKSVTDFGATGDGSTDDTAAVQAAADAGGWIFFPPGTYMLDEVTVTQECHFVADPSAILKMRSMTASTNQAVIQFSTGSDRSTWQGGRFDGNRSGLEGSYTDEVLTAIRTINAPDYIRVMDTSIQDFLNTGWYFGSGAHSAFVNIHVKGCGKGFIHQKAHQGRIANVTLEDIGNDGHAIYQHAAELRDANDFRLSGLRIIDFQPDNSGLEPTPVALAVERMDRMEAEGLVATGFTGATKPGMGFVFDALSLSTVRGISVDGGYDQGMSVQTCTDSAIDGFHIDLEYNTTGDGIGVRIRNGGLYPAVDAGAVPENARANDGCRNMRFANGLVLGAEVDGYAVQSGGVVLSHCSAIGCDNNGFRVDEDLTNSLFAGGVIAETSDVVLDACSAFNCGSNGLLIDKGIDVHVRGGTYSNNGQDTALGTNNRCGVKINDADRVSLVDVVTDDTQDWSTKTDGASFTPGATSGDQYEVSLIEPGLVNVGQYISLRDAGGSTVHATAKVVAKDYDDVTVEISGGFTFSASGNLTVLTGTYSTTGRVLNGSGSALNTEVVGRTYVVSGSDYRRVIRVNDADDGIIETAFPTDLSGATIAKVTVDVQPIASQQVGVRIETNATEVFISGATGRGNVSSLISAAAVASIKALTAADAGWSDVASAGTIAIPYGYENVRVTGTTGITTVAAGFDGQRVMLRFADALTVTDGSNLKLAGNFTTSADDILFLVCDGTNWYETGRSAN